MYKPGVGELEDLETLPDMQRYQIAKKTWKAGWEKSLLDVGVSQRMP